MERPFSAYRGTEPYVFVSYAHVDDEMVYPELIWLHDQGFNVWYDEGITPGSEWTDELARKITAARVVLFLVTPRSVDSRVCQQEVKYAVSKEVPLIRVDLEPTTLPPGLELSLSHIQAILRDQFSEHDYRRKLIQSLGEFTRMPKASEFGLEWRESGSSSTGASEPVKRSKTHDEDYDLSIAIQKFRVHGDDPAALEYSSAITQELETLFVGYREIRVNSEAESASYVLDGTVQPIGDTVRVISRLARVGDGMLISSKARNVGPVPSHEVAEAIGRNVRFELVNDFNIMEVSRRCSNPEAIAAYRAALLEQHKVNQGGRVDYDFQLSAAKMALDLESMIDAYWLVADAHFEMGNTKAGYSILEEGLAKDPSSVDLLSLDAWTALRIELDYVSARTIFEQILGR